MLRDSQRGPEVLMVRRRAGDAFGESYTFPGGILDADESLARNYCDGVSADEANALLNVPDGGLDYFSAVIRELFEETGILLARKGNEWPTVSTLLQALRKNVDQATLAWPDFLHEQGLRMACDAVHYFAYWETPRSLPKRWSTRFFLARTPDGQVASHDDGELTDIRWLTASDALAAGRSGDMKLPFPTVATLKDLADFDSCTSVLNWAQTRAQEGIDKILPVMLTDDGKTKIVTSNDD